VNFYEWAARWAIPAEAIKELQLITGTLPHSDVEQGLSEAAVQNNVRLQASKHGCRLMRNNVGVYYDERGVPVRYGLMNDSKKLNKKIKSSDLIGIKPVKICPKMIGHTLGVFVAREVKPAGWTYSATEREKAQLAFINLINSLGGDAKFTTGEN